MINENNFSKEATSKIEKLILLCLMVLIFLIHIRKIEITGTFIMLDDEFGYWGNAAYMAGLNWSNTLSQIPYYSYGYSLLLVPLYWIFNNPIHMYKAAIVLNGIMLSISFLLCYDIAKILMNRVNRYTLIGISFLISMYPAYVVYSSITWPECLLILVCWLITWCFVRLDDSSSNYKFVLIGFLSGYVYIIHQRSLGILIACITVILIMKILNKINFKKLLSVVLPIALLMMIHYFIKDNIQSNLWLNSIGNLTNDYIGAFAKLNQIFSMEGLVKVIKVFIGQIFYLGVASYLIFYFGLYELIQKTGKTIISSIKSKNLNILKIDDNIYLYLFLLIALILTIAISVISLINPSRIDHIVYGRYTEMILGPILLLGSANIMDKKIIPNKVFFLILVSFGLLATMTDFIISQSNLNVFVTVHSTGLVFMYTPLSVLLPAIIAILGCILLNRSFSKNRKGILITIICISGLFFFTGETVTKSMLNSNRDEIEIMKVVDLITATEEKMPIYILLKDYNSPVYGKWDSSKGRDRFQAEQYQFLLKDENIRIVNKEDLSKKPGDKFVIVRDSIDLFDLTREYKICVHAVGDYLLVSKSINLNTSE